eukprot:1379128-Rhodomonas_salina.1
MRCSYPDPSPLVLLSFVSTTRLAFLCRPDAKHAASFPSFLSPRISRSPPASGLAGGYTFFRLPVEAHYQLVVFTARLSDVGPTYTNPALALYL